MTRVARIGVGRRCGAYIATASRRAVARLGSLALASAVAACAGGRAPDAAQSEPEASSERAPLPSRTTRFAIELSDTTRGPFFVQLGDEDGQPAWVRVTRESVGVHLRPRCEIEDCEGPAGVCGMSLPTVVDLAEAPERRVELEWDRTVSVVRGAPGCEIRVPAEPGSFVARFCHASGVALEEPGVALEEPGVEAPMVGRLVEPTCVDVPFELDDDLVLLRR